MPASFVILLGLLIAITGVILFFTTKYKKVALAVLTAGVIMAVGMFTLIAVALRNM